ncbi:hypothetical protein [Desulfobaculum bizertense]|uniref:Uncharacterized protein n=1 Tax=Desulfobaculum bizertense DSM 18034 TaxID=1121442 RepID=A0A1T4X349_9BACT|nr:hypothetical protein [Desulfobaculum bizertense]UIJ37556.1 hypothetical protein LWC08_12725 [Desulfobaculum bizertense]SKA84012.1 hypothetical protein SAMN02745702_02948 [Desulfobaculum bizertense DSM 18034]
MRFRTLFTLCLFLIFINLCGYELVTHIKASMARDIESVRYVRSLDAPSKDKKKPKVFNVDKILEHTDVNG